MSPWVHFGWYFILTNAKNVDVFVDVVWITFWSRRVYLSRENGSRSRGFHLRWHYYSIFTSLSSVRSRLRASKEWRERKKHTHTSDNMFAPYSHFTCIYFGVPKNTPGKKLEAFRSVRCVYFLMLFDQNTWRKIQKATYTHFKNLNKPTFICLFTLLLPLSSLILSSQFLLTWLHFSC